MRYLLALLLMALLCPPASANVIRPMEVHLGAGDLMATCSEGFSWSIDGAGYGCEEKNCDGEGGNCYIACTMEGDCLSSTPDRQVQIGDVFNQAALDMALGPPTPSFGLAHVSRTQLLSACKSVPNAVFMGDKSQYMCVRPHCDPAFGACYIDCDLSKCTAATPKPVARMTLVAILQAGSNVVHRPAAPEDDDTENDNRSDHTTPPPPPPVIIQ